MLSATDQRSDPRVHFTKIACATAPGILACCYELLEGPYHENEDADVEEVDG